MFRRISFALACSQVERYSSTTTSGGINLNLNLNIEREKHKLDQIYARNIRMTLDKRIAFSK